MKKCLLICGVSKHKQIQAVCDELDNFDFEYRIVDPEDDTKSTIDLDTNGLIISGTPVEPFAIWAAYKDYSFPYGFSPEWADRKAHSLEWGGVLNNLYSRFEALCYNKLHAGTFGYKKLFQLELARSLGFSIPRTVVTNDAAILSSTFDGVEMALTKLIGTSALPIVRQPGVVEGYTPMAEIYPVEYLCGYFEETSCAPIMVQEYIEREYDYRVIVVGLQVFAAKISKPKDMVDSRLLGGEQCFEFIDLPSEMIDRLFAFMKKMDLNFGHFDFVEGVNGEPIFLECNPNGMWGVYDLDRRISSAYAEFFASLAVDNF